MNVNDLISKLQHFAAQSPENGNAEVKLQYFDDCVYGILGANNAKGFDGQHFLIMVPDVNQRLGVRELRLV